MRLRKIKYLISIFVISVVVFSINYLFIIPTSNTSVLKKVVVLDAGHGGEDGGAVSETGIIEKDLNLVITLKIKEILERNNYEVILTRENDLQLYNDNDKTIHSKKVSDINKRIEIINSSNADMLISVHMNSFTQEQYSGWQTFYKQNCVYSSKVAENIQNSIGEIIKKENKRTPLQIKGVKIIEKSTIPAILVECGFLSNNEEAESLNTDEYQNKLAEGIARGIINSYKNE